MTLAKKNNRETSFFPKKRNLIALGFLVITALLLRLYHIDNPLLDFHPARQYRSALKARAYYFDSLKSIPEWRKNIAKIDWDSLHTLEPPLMEHLASLSYRFAGGEKLWIPRVLSCLFWLVGGVFLYLLAKRIFSSEAALFSVALYLFFPFGILASRSIQPDSLMVMGLLISLFSIIRYYEQPSFLRLFVTVVICALAVLIKFVSFFVIVGAFIFIGLYTQGFRRFIVNPHILLFIIINIIFSLIYSLHAIFISKSLYYVARGDIIPHFLNKAFFWKGWLTLIGIVLGPGRIPGLSRMAGYVIFMVAILGLFTVRDKISRATLYGIWSGYLVFCLVFSYTTHTHDYWHLQLLPIAALSIAPVVKVILNKLHRIRPWLFYAVAFSSLISIIVLGFFFLQTKWKRDAPLMQRKLIIAKEIGENLSHSTKTLFLSEHYGKWLKYHGELLGLSWPTHWDIKAEKIKGKKVMSAEERLHSLIRKHHPDFFIVTFLEELDRQKDLKELLYKEFPLFLAKKDYLIFDLRERKEDIIKP